MANERADMKNSTVEADYADVVAQLAALREDMAKLASSLSSAASNQSQAFAKDVTDGMAEAARYVGRKTHDADVRLEGAVAANPYMALGMAAVVGLLLGALTRR